MFFHIEERQAWVRTQTHTLVMECDPDFPRFAQDATGNLQRIIRVWVTCPAVRRNQKQTYLGAFTLMANQATLSDLSRFFRKTNTYADASGQSPKTVRRQLISSIRGYISEGSELGKARS